MIKIASVLLCLVALGGCQSLPERVDSTCLSAGYARETAGYAECYERVEAQYSAQQFMALQGLQQALMIMSIASTPRAPTQCYGTVVHGPITNFNSTCY